MQVQASRSERASSHGPSHCYSATHSTPPSMPPTMQLRPPHSPQTRLPTHHIHQPSTHHTYKAPTKDASTATPSNIPSVVYPKCHKCRNHGVQVIEEGVKSCNRCYEDAKKRRPGQGTISISRPACINCQRNLVDVKEGEIKWCNNCYKEAVGKRNKK